MEGDNSDGGPAAERVERFRPTSGRVFGVTAVALALVVAVAAVVGADSGVTWWVVALALFFAALSWASLLRPVVAIEDETLVLRNMVSDTRIPLAAIEEIVVRQVLAVRAGDRRYTSPAVGRSRRQMFKDDRNPPSHTGPEAIRLAEESYGLFVEERIKALAQDARDRRGITRYSSEQEALAAQVERSPAVPEIVALLVSGLAFVVLVVV